MCVACAALVVGEEGRCARHSFPFTTFGLCKHCASRLEPRPRSPHGWRSDNLSDQVAKGKISRGMKIFKYFVGGKLEKP